MIRWIISLLLLLSLSNNLLWASLVPFAGNPRGAPDEVHHLEVARFIAEEGRLPVFGPGQDLYIRVPPGGRDDPEERIYGWYALFPSGAYIFAALVARMVAWLADGGGIYPFRLFSVLSGVLTVYLAYRIGRRLFPASSLLVLGLPAMAAFIPQVTYTNSYLNPDSFTMMASSLVAYLWLEGTSRGWSRSLSLALGFGLALVALGKYNGWLMAFPLTPLVLLLSLRSRVSEAAPRLLAMALPPLLVLGWWFARNYALYGDILAQSVFEQAWIQDRPTFAPYAQRGFSFPAFLMQSQWGELTFKSFWGLFGYMRLPLPDSYYWALGLLSLLALLGLVLAIWQSLRREEASPSVRLLGIYAVATLLLLGASLYTNYFADFQPQGRYLFPALIPISLFFLLGLREVAGRVRLEGAALVALSLGLMALNMASLFHYVAPLNL